MTGQPVHHSTFVLDRLLPARPKDAFRAWSNVDAKRRWSQCHENAVHDLDFRTGGSETNRVEMPDGSVYLIDASYIDIAENERIIYSYSMRVGEALLSASLVTVAFEAVGAKTRMIYTEQIALPGGSEDAVRQRIEGTEKGLDRLVLEVGSTQSRH